MCEKNTDKSSVRLKRKSKCNDVQFDINICETCNDEASYINNKQYNDSNAAVDHNHVKACKNI